MHENWDDAWDEYWDDEPENIPMVKELKFSCTSYPWGKCNAILPVILNLHEFKPTSAQETVQQLSMIVRTLGWGEVTNKETNATAFLCPRCTRIWRQSLNP